MAGPAGGQSNTARARYWLESAAGQILRWRRRCPACGYDRTSAVARKYLVTELRRCDRCDLLFRVPTTPAGAMEDFYEADYADGVTTGVPSASDLAGLLANGFAGHEKDYARVVSILAALGVAPGSRIFEFGASWGYGAWQLERRGYRVDAFEVSRGRAEYGRRHLGVSMLPEVPIDCRQYDACVSVHVIEHAPNVTQAIADGLSVLRPGGVLVALTPNGSAPFRQLQPEIWMRAWGLVHPNFLDDRFYRRNASARPICVMSDPFDLDALRGWAQRRDQFVGNLSGVELLFATARP